MNLQPVLLSLKKNLLIKANNIEGETYDTDALIINGQEITNTALGHVYANINVDTDYDGQIDLGE